jgi:glucose/arabinose dehydrogenase
MIVKNILFIVITAFFGVSTLFAGELPLYLLQLPKGFHISIFASAPNAREMTLGEKGTIFVGSLSVGKVYAIVPQTKEVIVIASNLTMPSGVAFRKGSLYVAANNQILRFDKIEENLKKPDPPVLITKTLPEEKHHGWRYIAFGPDDKLYVGIGMPCNVCLKKNPIFGSIVRMNPDGSDLELFATGIRNTVGFDWDPQTKQLWFTDNGRDWLGDNQPPDKINHAPALGMNFGFPYINGKNLPDPRFAKIRPKQVFAFPTYELPAHVAPLGLIFYRGTEFPKVFHNQIFVAEHGSWNRSQKVGYQVIVVEHKNNQIISAKPFISGWLQGQQAWGRPVAFLNLPDGSLLISDDFAGVIYQITYKE